MSIIYIYIKKKTLNVFKKIFLVLLILLVFIYIKYPTKIQKLLPQSLNIQSNNILTEDTIINKIKDVNKLIPLEIELSQTLTVDNTYFNLDIFKKSKKITFFANCSYSIDFSTLSTNNIKIDNSNKEIYITIPKIDIFSIDIDENKTIYGDTEVGLLRFGDLKLSSEEINEIYINANDMFSKKMNNQDFYTQTLKNAENSLESLLFNLTGEHYDITLTLSLSFKNTAK